jgi:peptidyl-tRNA hydrolase
MRTLVMCIRKDLKMKPGKVAAQCMHAQWGLYRHSAKRHLFDFDRVLTLKVDNAEHLETLQRKARRLGISHYVQVDAGCTQVLSDTPTVLALGPDVESTLVELTRDLKLY